MTKKTRETVEQPDLIPNYTPEFVRKMRRMGRAYADLLRQRMKALGEEVDYKEKIIAAMAAEGVDRFVCEGMTITIKASKQTVKVKFADEEEGDDDGDSAGDE